jgi:ABC-type branched-subunit amino acid transport system ATPase component
VHEKDEEREADMRTILEMKNATISFGGIKAVQNISFQIDRGEVLGLIGPNGSGKSTCVNLITGVYLLDSGEIYFKEHLIPQKMKLYERARLGMARTFQTPKPYTNMNVYDNVLATALLKNNFEEAHKKTRHVLKLTELAPLQGMMSGKLPIEKRKWLDLARAMVTDPELIMMDEAMAGLNAQEMNNSLELVRRINAEGVSVLFIEHVMRAVIALCHRCVVLNSGELLAIGEPREVLSRPEVLDAYIGEGDKE